MTEPINADEASLRKQFHRVELLEAVLFASRIVLDRNFDASENRGPDFLSPVASRAEINVLNATVIALDIFDGRKP